MIELRDYQRQTIDDIENAWSSGAENVCAVMPTGAGKTTVFSSIIHDEKSPVVAIAHRQELVTQISLSLARFEVPHQIIGPDSVIKLCNRIHMEELGQSFYHPQARCAVAGVDTLIRRNLGSWAGRVKLWVQDECHHLLAPGTNKWGTAAAMFPNARGLGVTATPMRADGKGLGRHADGLMDTMILGPSMRDLINRGFLCDYRVFGVQSDLQLDPNEVGASGDYSPKQLRNAAKKSHIVGDVVDHYIRIARGKLGVTFATDVETAGEITKRFNENGVPAALVHAGTPDAERIALTRRFARRELLQMVNVDLFGEGYDLPALEVVSFARPTESYGLYVQQFGRALRPSPGKNWAIIIDHVGNVGRHGLPDRPRQWTLDRRDKRRSTAATDTIPLRYCQECTQPYERIHKQCPWCGHVAIPATRNGPEQVDGDLTELDPVTLAMMRGQVEVVDISVEDYGRWLKSRNVPDQIYAVNIKRHVAKQESQRQLREQIAWWAGEWRAKGSTDSEIYRRFYFKFGVDVMTAKTLGIDESTTLRERIVYERIAMVG